MKNNYVLLAGFVLLSIPLYGMLTVPQELVSTETPQEEPALGYTPSGQEQEGGKQEKEHLPYTVQNPKKRAEGIGMWENVYEHILLDDKVPVAERADVYEQLGFARNFAPTAAPLLGLHPNDAFNRKALLERYRALTFRFHPDKQPKDNELQRSKATQIMQMINPAYKVLIEKAV